MEKHSILSKEIFINYICPVKVPLVFSQFSLRGRDEMKLLISLEMMITMMQMILTRVRNVAVTGRQSRDGDMRPGLDNGRVFAGPGGAVSYLGCLVMITEQTWLSLLRFKQTSIR